MTKDYRSPDLNYVARRNALIPRAEKIAYQRMVERFPKRKNLGMRDVSGFEFSRAMTELAIEEGLVSKEMMTIFNAKELPYRGRIIE